MLSRLDKGALLSSHANSLGYMDRILIWDIPTRVFHWAFAASLTGALVIGFLVDEESPLFQWHMLLGIAALFLLAIRLLLGLFGSRYSRFSSFPLHPRELMRYIASALLSKTRRYAGNNPGSALAAVIMFALVPALFATGTGWSGDDLHEALAWALLATVAVHLMGLAWHTLRHKENIATAMISGRKTGCQEDAIPSSHALWGLVILLVCGAWIGVLFASHVPGAHSVTLPVLGVKVTLGENESSGETSRSRHDRDD